MEKPTYSKQGSKRKAQQIGLGGGAGNSNIGGIVLWGGALAVASLAAAFAVKKATRKNANHNNSRRKENKATQGHRFVLQNSSPNFLCDPCSCASDGSTTEMVATQNSCEIDSAQSLILVENPDNQEIPTTDDSKEDGIKSCDRTEEFSCLVPNLPSLSELKNDLAEELPSMETSQVRKEGVVETEQVNNIERASLMHPVSILGDESDTNGNGEDVELVKEVLHLVESFKVEQVEEPVITSSTHSVEEEECDKEKVEDLCLKGGIQIWKDGEEVNSNSEKNADITSSKNSVGGERCRGDEENAEPPSLIERIEASKEEESVDYVSNTSADMISLSCSVEEGDRATLEESPFTERIQIWKEEEAIDGAPKEIPDLTSTLHLVEEEKQQQGGGGEEHDDDDDDGDNEEEYSMEKGKESSEETGSTSAVSNAEEVWPLESIESLSRELNNIPEYSAAKITVEEDRTTKAEECNNIFNAKYYNFHNCRDDYQTTQAPVFLKKEETLKHILVKDQLTSLTKWRRWFAHIIVLALVVLLLYTHGSAPYYLSY